MTTWAARPLGCGGRDLISNYKEKLITPKQRVDAILKGQPVDKIPFTCYNFIMYAGEAERNLRNRGLCYLAYRGVEYYNTIYHNTPDEIRIFMGEDGIRRQITTYHTPKGVISQTGKLMPMHYDIAAEHRPFQEEYLFKSPADYEPVMAMIEDRSYTDNYKAVNQAQRELGEDGIILPFMGYSPMQEIIFEIMGIVGFSMEWHNNRSRLMELYELLIEDRRKIYPIMANGPFDLVIYGGNVVPAMIGPERFEKYYIPHYNELADMLHANGKLLGVHFDACTRPIAGAIAGSKIDVIEAFDINCDMSMAEARQWWPDKIISVNFPSPVHLQSLEEVEKTAQKMLEEAAPLNKFIMGVTENVPHDRWPLTFSAIDKVLEEYGPVS